MNEAHKDSLPTQVLDDLLIYRLGILTRETWEKHENKKEKDPLYYRLCQVLREEFERKTNDS